MKLARITVPRPRTTREVRDGQLVLVRSDEKVVTLIPESLTASLEDLIARWEHLYPELRSLALATESGSARETLDINDVVFRPPVVPNYLELARANVPGLDVELVTLHPCVTKKLARARLAFLMSEVPRETKAKLAVTHIRAIALLHPYAENEENHFQRVYVAPYLLFPDRLELSDEERTITLPMDQATGLNCFGSRFEGQVRYQIGARLEELTLHKPLAACSLIISEQPQREQACLGELYGAKNSSAQASLHA